MNARFAVLLVVVAALLAGALLVVVPAALPAWLPLHARCIGAMALSLALSLALARRALDPAALRMPLLLAACWALGSALALWRTDAAWWAAAGLAVIAALAWRLARIDDDPPAPAQHADALLLTLAGLCVAAALLLLASPASAARHWPWPLAPRWVAQYAPLFLAWGVAAALAARERRRYVRAPVLWGLLAWALGTLGASLWHAAVLRWSEPAAWLWITVLAGVALTAAQRLGLHRRLGLRSRDSGTAGPRQ